MSSVVYPFTLNLFCLFGICSYKYNYTTQTVDCTHFRLIYSVIFFLFTSVSLDYATASFYFDKISQFGLNTYEITKIIENMTRSIIYNFCLTNLLLRRRRFVSFLNNLNRFQRSIESELHCNISTEHDNYREMGIILLLIAYLVLISAITLLLSQTILTYRLVFMYILSCLKFLSILLLNVKICNLSTILLNRYELIFNIVNDSIKKHNRNDVQCKHIVVIRLVKCFQKLEELNEIKMNFSELFGTQILLIVSFNFVVATIAFYFSLFPSIQTDDIVSIINFVIFNSPYIVALCWMVVLMDRLGQQVDVLSFAMCERFLFVLSIY